MICCLGGALAFHTQEQLYFLMCLCYGWYMRLTKMEIKAIKDTIARFDTEAKVYLYGSRVDDMKRGGDIDLLIISSNITEINRRELKLNLFDQIGEQKIDIVIASDTTPPFVQIALENGVLL